MRKVTKIIIIAAVLILAFCVFLLLPNLVVSPKTENVTINNIQSSYGSSENIILGGRVKANVPVILFFDNKIGMVTSNSNGDWSANLGKMPEGNYAFQALAEVSQTKNSSASANIFVVKNEPVVSLLKNNLFAGVSAYFLGKREQVILISKDSPEVLQGKWNLVK